MITEKNQNGSIFGASLLISGCCIGAGMLGMPVVTREVGFIPSTLLFFLSWLFMTSSALVLVEVALWFPTETNMAEMAKKYLGRSGELIVFVLMLFLMYTLMTAYSSGSGELIADFFEGSLNGWITPSIGSLLFALVLGLILVFGTRALDWFNRLFMAGLVLSYLALVYYGIPEVDTKNLLHSNWRFALGAFPIMVVSFGFQNLVPSLVRYLDRDPKKIRSSILIGSLIPLGIYLVWEFIILGLIAADHQGLEGAQMATSLIRKAAQGLDLVLYFADFFAFFAITTSFMGNALSVLDFLSDQAGGSRGNLRRALFALLAVAPPTLFAYYNPQIFLRALGVAGGFSAIVLFGLIPALMCLRGRRERKLTHFSQKTQNQYYFPGGNLTLMALVIFSLALLLIS